MKLKIGWERTLFSFILFYPLIHILLTAFFSGLSTKVVLLFLVFIYIYFLKHTTFKSLVVVNTFIVFYILYNYVNYHLYQITHSDFYTFILLILVFAVYQQKDIVLRFYHFLVNKEKAYMILEILFFSVLLYTMIFSDGLRRVFGSKILVLYGPYDVPHMLGYILIVLYCLNAFFQRQSRKRRFMILKGVCIVMVIWTAARSAVLGLAIIIFADYISIKNLNKKFIICGLGLIGILYLALFTDFIVNNPLMQKTLSALANGSITNGRSVFSGIAMDYYFNGTNLVEKSFGIGMNNLRNQFLYTSTIRVAIHAHNDYVNALVGYGIIGLVIYIIGQLQQIKVLEDWKMKCLIELMIFILAYYNGFAMYAMFTPCLIILYVFMNQEQYMKMESKAKII